MGRGGNKTIETHMDVKAYLATVSPSERAEDGRTVAALMERLSGAPARLWGPTIIGFGRYHYRYDSGREGDAPRIAFAPRKADLVFYLAGLGDDDLASLGRWRRGKGCLYVKRLSDIDIAVLEALIVQSLDHMQRTYPA